MSSQGQELHDEAAISIAVPVQFQNPENEGQGYKNYKEAIMA